MISAVPNTIVAMLYEQITNLRPDTRLNAREPWLNYLRLSAPTQPVKRYPIVNYDFEPVCYQMERVENDST
jgi:hypothetical protein